MTLEEFNKNRMQNIKECKDKIMDDFKKLSIKDQLLYDFTNDCDSIKYINNNSAIDKYFIYKAKRHSPSDFILKNEWTDPINKTTFKKGEVGYKEGQEYVEKINDDPNYNGIVDPDSNSKLLQKIYNELWKNINDKSYMLQKNGNISGDTMTSFSNSLKIIDSSYTVNKCFQEYATNKNKMSKKIMKNEQVYVFMKLYHTIGNFIPVPSYFNSARCGKSACDDYWFLTLKRIKDYFSAIDDQEVKLKKLLPSKKRKYPSTVPNTKEWLNSYEKDFEAFLNINYLQDYKELELIGYDKNGSEFIKKVNEVILKRGIRMLKELNDDKNKKNECEELLKKDYDKLLEELIK